MPVSDELQLLFAQRYVHDTSSVIIGIDSKEVVVLFNSAAEEFLGIPAEDIIGRSFSVLMEKTKGSQDSILLNSLYTGKPYSHVEATIESSHGVTNVMAYTTVLKDENNRIAGAVLTLRDITSQKQLEEKVVNDQKLWMIGEIAADIADEIRNPMTSVKGFLQLLNKRFNQDEQMKQYIELMLQELNNANSMISGLILSARPMVPIKEKVNPGELLDIVVSRPDIAERFANIRINRTYHKTCPAIEVDPEQIKRVATNLIINAIESMTSGGWLELSCTYRPAAKTVILKIADTGVGIHSANFDRVFEPFFTTKQGRTGLGLTISQKIVENHGGSIVIESKKGCGTVVTVNLPAVSEDNSV